MNSYETIVKLADRGLLKNNRKIMVSKVPAGFPVENQFNCVGTGGNDL